MIDPSSDAPPPIPARPWIVRMLGPRPADTFGAQCAEIFRRTAWILPCEILLIIVLGQLGVSAGNAGSEEIADMAKRGALYLFAVGVVLAPALEEVVFRFVPSLLSDLFRRRKDGQRWALGIPMALVFALVHNLTGEASTSTIPLVLGLHFTTAMVPASQFLFGLLLWDLMRRYGLWACAFSHMLHNLVFLSLLLVAPEAP